MFVHPATARPAKSPSIRWHRRALFWFCGRFWRGGKTPILYSTTAITIMVVILVTMVSGCRVVERQMNKRMADRTPHGCAECHADIVQQWQQSAHAQAWTSPEYLKATDDHSYDQCLSCHASRPLLDQPPSTPPELRDFNRHHGIDCNTCHQKGCKTYVGPYNSLIGPHPVEQDTTVLPSSAACGVCHETEFDEYESLYVPSIVSCRPRQCAECHMPAYQSRLTQGHILSLIHPKRRVRNHAFPTWSRAVSKGAIEISAPIVTAPENDKMRIAFSLTNRGAGHSIPTGQYGYRELRIRVQVLDDTGTVVAQGKRSILARGRRKLEPGKAADFSFLLEAPKEPVPANVRILVDRVNRDRSFQYLFIDRQWSIP